MSSLLVQMEQEREDVKQLVNEGLKNVVNALAEECANQLTLELGKEVQRGVRRRTMRKRHGSRGKRVVLPGLGRLLLQLLERPDTSVSTMKGFCGVSRMFFQQFYELIKDDLPPRTNRLRKDYVPLTKKVRVALFLAWLVNGQTLAATTPAHQRVESTICKSNWKVLSIVIRKFKSTYLGVLPSEDDILAKITNRNPMYAPFGKCIGAIDGTSIPILTKRDDCPRFRSHKTGSSSMNLVVCCNFRFKVVQAVFGIEGAACDSVVFEDFLKAKLNLDQSSPFFYLGDAIFRNSQYMVTPFRGYAYHLEDWKKGNRIPANKYELFNLRHAQLRNIIERLFGVIKNKFRILKKVLRVDVRRADYVDGYSNILCGILILFGLMRDLGEITVEDFKKKNINKLRNLPADVEVEEPEFGNNIVNNNNNNNNNNENSGDLRMSIANKLWSDYSQQRNHQTASEEISQLDELIGTIFMMLDE